MKINGKLAFDASSSSVIENLRIERVTSNPTATAADVGRLIFNTTDNRAYVGVVIPGPAYSWSAVANGGDASAVQAEVDNVEVSLGAGINADGTFNAAGFPNVTGILVSPTSFTNAINQLANAINASNTLGELGDVTLTSTADNDLLQYDSGTSRWVNVAIGSVSGVQAWDAGLDALAAYNTNGILVQTANNTFAGRSLVAPAAGITITNANGVSGNPTFALANDLAALEGLTTTGYVIRTGDGTATTRQITGTSGRVVVTNGDGVASDTNVDLATVTPGSGGTFQKFSVDSYGRVNNVSNVVAADITALVDAAYVNVTGDTMNTNASLVFSGTGTVTGLPTPTAASDAANKAYVDAVAAGLSWKQAVRVATTTNVNLSTALENGDVIDGVTLVTGNRVLVKNQTTASANGIYIVQASGAAVRATDMDAAAEFAGATVFVTEGTVNADTGWTQTAEVVNLGTDPVVFVQFSGSSAYTWGVGLTATGNTVNVNVGAGITELPTDEVGIDLYDVNNSAIILTTNGTARSTSTAAQLYLLLDPAGGMQQTSAGLKIGAGAVTNAMLANNTLTLNGDSGTDTIALGQTLLVAGSSVQGIVTAVTDNTITVSGINASTTQKGVASFDSSHFSVTAGAVSLNASLDDLTNVSTADAAATNSLLQKSAGDWVAVTPAAVAATINLGDLADVGTATPTDGHVLVGDGSVFNTQKVYHLHTEGSAATTWVVTHNLGQKYCNVTVVDSTDNVIIPESIVFNTTNQLTVTFNTAISGKVVVMGIA